MVYGLDMDTMPQMVPTATFLPSFDYSTFQFDLSLLSDDYDITSTDTILKPPLIKEETCSPRACSPLTFSSPARSGLGGELSPNYSRDCSPGYPTSPYDLPHSPQSAQFYPTSPEPIKQPARREKSLDLLAILQESRLLAESLGYKEDSSDCTVPCTPTRTEEDIYNTLDADFHPKKDANPLLKEILFKEEHRSTSSSPSSCSAASISSASSLTVSNSPASLLPSPGYLAPLPSPASISSLTSAASPAPEVAKSPLRDLLFKPGEKDNTTEVLSESITELLISDEDDILVLESSSSQLQEGSEMYKTDSKGDHQLLREVLRDTSFQRKFNLKPIDLGSVGTGFVEDMEPGECVGELAREQIEPVLSLAIQQLQKDFDNTCVALGIHPEPRRWSAADVAAWVQWARRQLQLPPIPLENFNIDGSTLASFTEEDFCQRAPECGGILYAQFEIWKTAVEESPRNTLAASWSPAGVVPPPSDVGSTSPPSAASSAPGSVQGACTIDFSDDEDEETSSATGNTSGKMRSSGSHIHLWQFLKELLQSPSIHGSCIRWLDRTKGVFKIEDSVRVARLWGKRKNRPAMNYDKLSRSIRQYYKKGIMKKTERSQRLVYQFCHPYNL